MSSFISYFVTYPSFLNHELSFCQHLRFFASQFKYSLDNEELTLNDSLNDLAPSEPISLSVRSNSSSIVSCHHVLALSLLFKFSSVNAVLFFNDSPSDFAPSSPILFSIGFSLHSSFSIRPLLSFLSHHPSRVWTMNDYSSMIHPAIFPLLIQFCSLTNFIITDC